jgi:hypothetical protein
VRGTLTFTRPDDVVPDEERSGLLRARPVREGDAAGDAHSCDLVDLAAADALEPGLEAAGFETVDLSGNAALQGALREVGDRDQLTEDAAATIRESLAGMHFRLANGTELRVDMVVDDGLFHRRSGPNWLDVNPDGIDGINGHGGAQFVHGDQDVFGTPLRQLLGGAAPDMFRHVTPDGRNDDATTFLLNLWIPLHAPVQPLALMDRRTLDARAHQLRYGLPVDDFLERDDDATVNDIWSFLHDEGQQWYVRSEMGPDQGYVFDTLGTPHGAAALAGEDSVEAGYLALRDACAALDRSETTESPFIADLAPDASTPIRDLDRRMRGLLERLQGLSPDEVDTWRAEAEAAMDAAIRRSIEMRLVASVITP